MFADLCVDGPDPDLLGDGAAGVRRDVRAAFLRICALAGELGVDAVCCAGNLYDRAGETTDTVEFLRAGLAGLAPIPVFVAPGSTDWWGAGSLYARAGYWSDNVHFFTEPRLVPRKLGRLVLWGAAHVMPEHPVGFLDGFGEVTDPGVHIALFHGCELSVTQAHFTAPFTAAHIRRTGLNHALVGHVPRAHSAPEFTYPGRPAPWHEAQRNGGGAVLVNVDDAGQVLRHWHTVAAPPPSGSGLKQDFAAHPYPQKTSVFDLPQGTSPPNQLPPLIPTAPPRRSVPAWLETILDPTQPLDERYDVDEIAAQRTVRGEFVRRVRRASLGENQTPVLRMGLLAMDGRLEGRPDEQRPGGLATFGAP